MMALLRSFLAILAAAKAQSSIAPQTDTWNSSFALSNAQIAQYGLNSSMANNVNVATQFERTNWATGSVHNDSFYTVPANSTSLPAGSLLKVEQYTDTSYFTVPPNVALSRILFHSETLNGSTVPASAFVLWPWMPRKDPRTGRYAVVGWAHGTSGVYGECAPSHIRNLWYQYSAPFILALQGYVVVAPDYAGLGVDMYANGTAIRHPYLSNPSAANDLFYSVEAAQTAFSELSSNFVMMGHSQGGGAAWGAAQRQAKRPVAGYLGAVAGSPVTNTIALGNSSALALRIAYSLPDTLPGFNLSDFLTPKGVTRLKLLTELGACQSGLSVLDVDDGLVQPGWQISPYMQVYENLTENGGQTIAGPMLVLQGTADPAVPEPITTTSVNLTCAAYPQSELEYAMFEGSTHVPVLYSAQRVWLNWIADRFAGRDAAAPCTRELYQPAHAVENYQTEGDYYLEVATQGYEIA